MPLLPSSSVSPRLCLTKVLFVSITSLSFGALSCGQTSESGSDPSEDCNGEKCDDLTGIDSPYEFIIVGSGAGGGPLAANLARNGHSVLLLEAGDDMGGNLNYQIPAFHAYSTEDTDMRWDYFVDHYSDDEQAARDSKMVVDPQTGQDVGIWYPRAGTLGGCTAHNAQITMIAQNSDWNKIAEITGDETWSAAYMNFHWRNVRKWLGVEPIDSSIAAFDNKLKAIVFGAATAATGNLYTAFAELSLLLATDINSIGPEFEGLYSFRMATHEGARNGPREYLLKTVAEGYPLTIQTNSLATRVLFDDETVNQGTPRAIGVEMMVGEHLYTADPQADGSAPEPEAVFATREVILSAGAFNTPQLLKLSGIGPRDELATHGIEPLVDLPGVGENLQDRYEIGVVFELRGQLSTGSECTFTGTEDDPCFLEWRDRRSGPYTSNGGVVGIIKRSSRTLYDPDLFIFGVPSVFKGYQPGYSQESVGNLDKFTWLILKAHTKNTGSVRLRSANPLERPEINFAYFNDGANGLEDPDLQAMVNGVEFVRDIGRNIEAAMFAPSFGRFDEVFPGPDVAGAEAVAEFVRNEAWGHHASCTAKIGADDDPMAVLDSRFNVRGTDGLRVVDASVFPEIPGFFIAAPIYIVSEKATDVILEDLGESRISANQPVEPGN